MPDCTVCNADPCRGFCSKQQNPVSPDGSHRRDRHLHIRITEAELAHYKKCAKAAGLTFSQWVRLVLGEVVA